MTSRITVNSSKALCVVETACHVHKLDRFVFKMTDESECMSRVCQLKAGLSEVAGKEGRDLLYS
jgi:hypothetical protein